MARHHVDCHFSLLMSYHPPLYLLKPLCFELINPFMQKPEHPQTYNHTPQISCKTKRWLLQFFLAPLLGTTIATVQRCSRPLQCVTVGCEQGWRLAWSPIIQIVPSMAVSNMENRLCTLLFHYFASRLCSLLWLCLFSILYSFWVEFVSGYTLWLKWS